MDSPKDVEKVAAAAAVAQEKIPDKRLELKKLERIAEKVTREAGATEANDIKTAVSQESDIITGDMGLLFDRLPDDSVDLFFTDPPYGEEYLGEFGRLAQLAQAKLKPGGLCLTYAPHAHVALVRASRPGC